MNVYEKLLSVQVLLKANKNQYNSFGKYAYRSCEDILESVKPLLGTNKLSLIMSDEVIDINSRFYIKSTATVIDIESSEKVSVSALAREDETKKGMDLAQVTGSVSSYARKYALNGLFCIDDNKDSDSTNTHVKDDKKSEKQNPTTGSLTAAQIKRLFTIASGKNVAAEKVKAQILKKYNKKVEDLSKEEYDHICNAYQNMK